MMALGDEVEVVGEQDRRLVVAEVPDQELPERPVVVLQRDPLVDHAGGLELAVRHVEVDRPPGRAGQGRDLGDAASGERRRRVMKVMPSALSLDRFA